MPLIRSLGLLLELFNNLLLVRIALLLLQLVVLFLISLALLLELLLLLLVGLVLFLKFLRLRLIGSLLLLVLLILALLKHRYRSVNVLPPKIRTY